MPPSVIQRYATIEVSKPFFHYNANGDGTPNAETVCLLEIRLKGHPAQPDQIVYARGSACWSSKDRGGPNKRIGKGISEQRARRVLEWFSVDDYDQTKFKSWYDEATNTGGGAFGTGQGVIGAHRMQLLAADGLNDLERKILGISKPVAEESAPPPPPPA